MKESLGIGIGAEPKDDELDLQGSGSLRLLDHQTGLLRQLLVLSNRLVDAMC